MGLHGLQGFAAHSSHTVLPAGSACYPHPLHHTSLVNIMCSPRAMFLVPAGGRRAQLDHQATQIVAGELLGGQCTVDGLPRHSDLPSLGSRVAEASSAVHKPAWTQQLRLGGSLHQAATLQVAQSSSCRAEYISKAGMSAGLQWQTMNSQEAECARSCQDCKAEWAPQGGWEAGTWRDVRCAGLRHEMHLSNRQHGCSRAKVVCPPCGGVGPAEQPGHMSGG